jgi:leucyl-tRNA synthetase
MFNGMTVAEAQVAITAQLAALGKGGAKTTYKLRDWVF